MANAASFTCVKCGEKVPEFNKFCEYCGTAVGNKASKEAASKTETSLAKEAAPKTATNPVEKDGGVKDQESVPAESPINLIEDSPLAKGLPKWSIEPPVIAVRRKSKVS